MNAPGPQPHVQGRHALITGASRGIGLAIACALVQKGCRVTLLIRDSEVDSERGLKALEWVKKVSGQTDAKVDIWSVDLLDTATLQSPAVDLSDVDILVNNAAGYAPYGRLENGNIEQEANVLGVTLQASLELCRRVLPGMRERKFGRLLFVGSAAGQHGAAGQVAYAASKAGLIGLARSLASEAGSDGVTANVVAPGLIETERIREAVSEGTVSAIVANSAVSRIGQAQEVAALVSFLAGEEAGFITGAVIPVDGGLGLGVFHRPSNGTNSSTQVEGDSDAG